jgi:hypothetical protein
VITSIAKIAKLANIAKIEIQDPSLLRSSAYESWQSNLGNLGNGQK